MTNALPQAANGTERELRATLGAGIARLEAAGVPSAALAAELLLLPVLGRDRAWIYAHPESALTPEQQAAYARLLERRAAGEPTQHLTGRQEFWGLEFEVNPDVLIPRPETEHVVEVALERLAARRGQPLEIADVGTGSGCLAVALARELPEARVVATDISGAVLDVARRNAARHGVAERIEFAEMDLLGGYLAAAAREPRFDLVVSNPPYVGIEEEAQLPREVREHEPRRALFAGSNGMDIYPALIQQAAVLLRERGALVLELGHKSRALVQPLLDNPAWTRVGVARDLAAIERVISAERTAASRV